ncbi:hypothetical protein BDV98DRAFT_379383 [Pterulicium gracile]|uniref:Cytochrome P450 n=1 Tax=Pterulicium gracile TaxID=1884261 RepID=A0A5C3QPF3_9AGAR|nr:hypothetical protein BDV98DRAFT_379383 [Pterula gracilis]
MGQPFVLLNSSSAADDLPTKRSENYYGRHYTTMLHDIAGAEELSLSFMTYTNRWRAYGKHFHSLFRVQDVKTSQHIILDTSAEFLDQLASTPEDFRSHIRSYTSKIITKFVWGLEQPMATKDPLVTMLDELLDVLNAEMFNKLILVDVLPFLKHIPSSWPGARFKRAGVLDKARQKKISDGLYNRLQLAIADGTATPCMFTRSTENTLNLNGVLDEAAEQLIKNNAIVSLAGLCDSVCSLRNSLICTSIQLVLIRALPC